jgi:hypothetical protein
MSSINKNKKNFISKITNINTQTTLNTIFKDILYFPIQKIGSGSNGDVYEISNNSERFALKTGDIMDETEFIAGVKAGETSIGPIHYSFTVKNAVKNEDCKYIIMELLEGITLDNIRVSGSLIMVILDSYYYLFAEKDLVQDDLKAANILITNSNTVKILDYGSAKIINKESFDIMSNMMKMAVLLINSLTFEYKKYTPLTDSDYFNISNPVSENTNYFIELYNSANYWLSVKFKKNIKIDIQLNMNFLDENIINAIPDLATSNKLYNYNLPPPIDRSKHREAKRSSRLTQAPLGSPRGRRKQLYTEPSPPPSLNLSPDRQFSTPPPRRQFSIPLDFSPSPPPSFDFSPSPPPSFAFSSFPTRQTFDFSASSPPRGFPLFEKIPRYNKSYD